VDGKGTYNVATERSTSATVTGPSAGRRSTTTVARPRSHSPAIEATAAVAVRLNLPFLLLTVTADGSGALAPAGGAIVVSAADDGVGHRKTMFTLLLGGHVALWHASTGWSTTAAAAAVSNGFSRRSRVGEGVAGQGRSEVVGRIGSVKARERGSAKESVVGASGAGPDALGAVDG